MKLPFTKPLGIALLPYLESDKVYKGSHPRTWYGKLRVFLARFCVWSACKLLTKDIDIKIDTYSDNISYIIRMDWR